MDAKSLFVYGLMATGAVMADLRQAAQPRKDYVVRQRNPVQFVSKTAVYIEPSAFEYAGLAAERKNNYDNFLRSNIDNEQDKRNFNNEAGRDMLPVRTFEASEDSSSATVQTKLPAGAAGVITATENVPYVIPLRWNNPHAAELEVNVWIKDMTIVVPVRRPACAGEGHQDAAFSFTIPANFKTDVAAKVPGFTGCNQVGDCVLQIYAHSVEPRQYAIGTPLIITGGAVENKLDPQAAPTLDQTPGIAKDPGTDLSGLTHELCIPSSEDAKLNIAPAVPRAARLISDVANHAYQNSDYSPYSGQQPEAISKNLQAAVIIEMIASNGGELGKSIRGGALNTLAAKLNAKVKATVQANEAVVNKIIAQVGNKVLSNKDVDGIPAGALGTQQTATTFRAAEVGSVTTVRLKTTTYIPSFKLPDAASTAAAKALVPAKLAGLVRDDGTVQLYQAALNQLAGELNKAVAAGLKYYGPVVKTTPATLKDATDFKKRDAAGKTDGGKYAATQFAQTAPAKAAAAKQPAIPTGAAAAVGSLSADFEADADFNALSVLPADTPAPASTKMDGLVSFGDCDDEDATAPEDEKACQENAQTINIFEAAGDEGLRALSADEIAAQTAKSTNTATTLTSSIAAAALSALAAIFLA